MAFSKVALKIKQTKPKSKLTLKKEFRFTTTNSIDIGQVL
jgi:hypothetical protein